MEYTTDSFSLELDEQSGRITSIQGKQKFAASGSGLPLFTLRFRDNSGNPHLITSDELQFSHQRGDQKHAVVTLDFQGTAAQQVSVTVRLGMGERRSEIYWHLKVEHAREGYLEWIEFPAFCVPNELVGNGGDGLLFSPTSEGVLIENMQHRETLAGAYQPVEYPNHGWCGYYPGNAQMQFFAFSRTKEVLYLASHDAEHTTKELEFCRHEDGIRLIVRVYPGAIAAGTYELPYPMVMGVFQGDWQDAATRYREWIQSGAVRMPPKLGQSDGQRWLEESPIVISYPVTGDGSHAGPTQPNEFFPFVNAAPNIEKLGEALDSRILALLMHWEGTAPWSPPYVWPPRGGEEGLRKLVDKLHARDHLIGLYCSGVAWTNTSNTGDGGYNRQAELERDGLIKHMCRGPQGEYECKVCNCEELRFGYDICVATDFARQVMVSETIKMASVGVDYIQLFDQNLGGASYQCYDAEHGHPAAPGPWQAPAMNHLIGEVRSQLSEIGKSHVILGCEAAAAECYIGQLPLNDLRFNISFTNGRPVPAYAFVFHEYTTNFMGNCVEGLGILDHLRSPHNYMLRLAYSFCAGDLFAAVLKGGGEIQWAWCAKWDVTPPPQEPLLAFMKHLNQWRKGVGKPFLFFGRMEKTIAFDGPEHLPLHFNPASYDAFLNYSTVLASRWTSQDGRDAQFLVNYSDRPQVVHLRTERNYKIWYNPEASTAEMVKDEDGIEIPSLRAVLVEIEATL